LFYTLGWQPHAPHKDKKVQEETSIQKGH